MQSIEAVTFTGLIDLAQEKLGGHALIASDEFFAEKENLVKPGRGIFLPEKYTERGKWMDGWETRRKRVPGYDWCIIKLGLPGIIKGIDIDTNHFLGNHPPYASVDVACIDQEISIDKLSTNNSWEEILARSALKAGSQNLFAISNNQRWTHLRLNIYPDGGIARLKVWGVVAPNWSRIPQGKLINLAAIEHGGQIAACNDMFFGAPENLLMPGRGEHMGDAWETRRKRVPGYDWVIIKLGRPGEVKKIDVDTKWHIGNYPDMCSIDGCFMPDENIDGLNWATSNWQEILPKTKLEADRQHIFESELRQVGKLSHVRLNIFPDGGVARFRVFGTI